MEETLTMKRALAIILCLLLTAGVATVFVACGNGGNEVALADFPNVGVGGDDVAAMGTAGNATLIPFATLDDNDNATVLGLVDLFSTRGQRITLNDRSEVTVNRGECPLRGDERILSITAQGQEVLVSVQESDGVRTLYGRGWIAGSENDPYTVRVDLNAPLTTRAVATIATVPTTARTTATVDPIEAARREILNSDMTEQERQRAFRMLSYRMDGNGVFYTERDPWQKQFGFNALFDMASPFLQMVYGTIRLNFRYGYMYDIYQEGPNRNRVRHDANGNPMFLLDERGNRIPKDWLIQMWAGRYGLAMLGAEIGVYTKPSTQAAQHFFSAVEQEYVIMTISVYQHDFQSGRTQHLFRRGPHPTWWITGFVPGAFHNPYANNRGKSEVITVGTLTFPSPQMMNLVADAWVRAGFREINGIPTHLNPETLTRRGNSIHFSWQYMDQDVPSHRFGRPN